MDKDHEIPFPLYQGLKMHGDAQIKKEQIENAHEFGLSVFYGRVMEVKLAMVLPTNL